MDRASVFGTEGWGFESLRARHFIPTTLRNFLPILVEKYLAIYTASF